MRLQTSGNKVTDGWDFCPWLRAGKGHMVCRLRKSLYGLKQAPRNWYLLVSKFIVETMGFKATVSDPCFTSSAAALGG
jgi:hypothetical protein